MKQTIDILCDLVKSSEGCKLLAYPDPGSGSAPYTIGWGSTGFGIINGLRWTQEQADERLHKDLLKVIDKALLLSPNLIKQIPQRQAAIADFIYNCGEGNYRSSTLKKRVDAGDYPLAMIEILKWDKASGKVMKGLTIRRRKEAELLR